MTVTCAVCETPVPRERRGVKYWCRSIACYKTFWRIDEPAVVRGPGDDDRSDEEVTQP